MLLRSFRYPFFLSGNYGGVSLAVSCFILHAFIALEDLYPLIDIVFISYFSDLQKFYPLCQYIQNFADFFLKPVCSREIASLFLGVGVRSAYILLYPSLIQNKTY